MPAITKFRIKEGAFDARWMFAEIARLMLFPQIRADAAAKSAAHL
jgi:hypothetical protein